MEINDGVCVERGEVSSLARIVAVDERRGIAHLRHASPVLDTGTSFEVPVRKLVLMTAERVKWLYRN